jgi:hypothetical protein
MSSISNNPPLRNGHLASKALLPPPRPHDPEVCGIYYALSCPACQGEYYRDPAAQVYGAELVEGAIERWHALRLGHRSVLGDGVSLDTVHPEPLSPDQLIRLVWTLQLPPYRELFRELLLDLLAPGIAGIALGVKEERP